MGGVGGNNMQGMNEQEQAMVKMVGCVHISHSTEGLKLIELNWVGLG